MENFDKIVRERMTEGTEEVPSGLWNAIQDRLPASGAQKQRTPVVLLWTRRLAPVVAAAAAVALVVLFGGHDNGAPTIDIVGDASAEIADAPAVSCGESDAIRMEAEEYVPSAIPSHRNYAQTQETAPEAEVTAPEAETAAAEATAQVNEAAPAVETENAQEQKSDTVTQEQQAQTRQAQDLGRETAEKIQDQAWRRRADISVFGTAASNTNPGSKSSGGPMRVPAARPAATGITETSESSYFIPLSAGTSVRFHLTRRWAIDLGVNCTSLNRKYGGTYREVDDLGLVTFSESSSDIRNSQLYIGIPLSASFSIISNNFVDFYTYAGGTAEKCILNKHTMTGADGVKSFKDKTGGVVFSAGLGIGCEFTIGKHVGLYIDPSLRYYFKNSSTPKSIRTQQPLMAGLELGLRFRL